MILESGQNIVERISLLKILKNSGFVLCLFLTINGALLTGFIEATLDLHLSTVSVY